MGPFPILLLATSATAQGGEPQSMSSTDTSHGAHGRKLSTRTVTSRDALISAMADASVNHILIAPGTYKTKSYHDNFQLANMPGRGNLLTIEARDGPGTVTLSGQYSASESGRVMNLGGGAPRFTVHLIGLDITDGNGGGYSGGGVELYGPHSFSFTDCNIFGNRAQDAGGVKVSDGQHNNPLRVAFINTNIYDNTNNCCPDRGPNLYISGTPTPEVYLCGDYNIPGQYGDAAALKGCDTWPAFVPLPSPLPPSLPPPALPPAPPQGLHLADDSAKISFGVNSECEIRFHPGPPASLESTCALSIPASD
jgi:hypothetical protein